MTLTEFHTNYYIEVSVLALQPAKIIKDEEGLAIDYSAVSSIEQSLTYTICRRDNDDVVLTVDNEGADHDDDDIMRSIIEHFNIYR